MSRFVFTLERMTQQSATLNDARFVLNKMFDRLKKGDVQSFDSATVLGRNLYQRVFSTATGDFTHDLPTAPDYL
jgi:hypothetical protein